MMLSMETAAIRDIGVTPKYRYMLRPIGAHLDHLQAVDVMLAETEEGFVWRCFDREDRGQPYFGVIGHDEIPQMIQGFVHDRLGRVPDVCSDAGGHAVFDYGYEELLRCLSFKLDRAGASSFVLVEDGTSMVLQMTLRVPLYIQGDLDLLASGCFFREVLFKRPDIETLVRQVRGFRGSTYIR